VPRLSPPFPRQAPVGSRRRAWRPVVVLIPWLALSFAQAQPVSTHTGPTSIDLPTAMRLAGANNLEVQIAREKVAEASAASDATRAKFFPWFSPSIVVRRHEENIQAVNGPIIDAEKQSLGAGIAINAQVDLGETYYQSLAAKQRVRAQQAALSTRQRDMTQQAVAAYFDLARARAAVAAAEDSARITGRHAQQIAATAEAGLTFRGDAARVRAAHERAQLTVVRLQAEQRLAAARLAELLHLDPTVELVPSDTELTPLSLVNTHEELGTLLAKALAGRPELTEAQARLAAAKTERRGADVAPLVPTLGAQAYVGGLGGGVGSTSLTNSFDQSSDYSIGLSWRVGPGGLFDRPRQREAAARARRVEFEVERTREAIRTQVVEQYARVRSLESQIRLARTTLEAADETARLSRERRETGVSIALEDLQAEEELSTARREYLATIAEYNVAQYALRLAIGD